jgi:hypothetical protein
MADVTKKEIEELLSEQTNVMLNAVDDKLRKFERKMDNQFHAVFSAILLTNIKPQILFWVFQSA